jgi:hypothetical protein
MQALWLLGKYYLNHTPALLALLIFQKGLVLAQAGFGL